jgi:hypothetical protein
MIYAFTPYIALPDVFDNININKLSERQNTNITGVL